MAAAIPLVFGALGGSALGTGAAIAGTAALTKKALKPARVTLTQPAEPNIDEAAKERGEVDRIRRRRGVLANIFGGATSSGSPSVATKRLLGE